MLTFQFQAGSAELQLNVNPHHQLSLTSSSHLFPLTPQAGARLCKCLGEEFLPYLDIVMPSLLKSATVEADIKVSDLEDDDGDDEEEEDMEHIRMGDKIISIRWVAAQVWGVGWMRCCSVGCGVDGVLQCGVARQGGDAILWAMTGQGWWRWWWGAGTVEQDGSCHGAGWHGVCGWPGMWC